MPGALDAIPPPTVSIVMPVHNLEAFVAESIASVQAQTWRAWELIVIDDGSTDGTEAIVRGLAAEDPRIRLESQPNRGAASARNRGLGMMRGGYLVFLDGDDLWRRDFLAQAVAVLEGTGTGLFFCGVDYLKADGSREAIPMDIRPGPLGSKELLHLHVSDVAWLLMGNVVLRSTPDVRRLRFTDGCRHGEDTEYLRRAVSLTDSAHFVETPLFWYRVRPGSVTRQGWDWQVRIDAIHAMERALEHLMGRDQERYTTAIEEEIRRLHHSKYRFLYRMVKLGAWSEARALLAQEGWHRALHSVAERGRPKHRRKARVLLAQRLWAWRLVFLYARCRAWPIFSRRARG